jgi:hypothetical protein
MKTLRTHICCLIMASVLVSGCATTGHQDVSASESETQAWDDMTPAQKFLFYTAWPIQCALMWGGSALASH